MVFSFSMGNIDFFISLSRVVISDSGETRTNCHHNLFKGLNVDIYLLHLELDGGLEVVDLGVQVVTVGDESRELASLKLVKVKWSKN